MDTEDSVDEEDKDSLGLTALPEFRLNREYRDTLVLHGKSQEEAEHLSLGQIPLGSTSGPAKIRRAIEHLRTDVVKGLGIKLLDKILEIMEEEDDHKREQCLLHHMGDEKYHAYAVMYVIKKLNLTTSERQRRAAEQEAQLLSQLRHPNIVTYRESWEGDDCQLYIVMGFCEGGDLYHRLKQQKGELLPERQVVEWLSRSPWRWRNILHRDLKTQNIFLTKCNIIKVGDLGIARVLENQNDMASTLIGTPYYMSPELFSNKPYNHKSDVWALGCCVYEMSTLKRAFNARDMNSLVYRIVQGKNKENSQKYKVWNSVSDAAPVQSAASPKPSSPDALKASSVSVATVSNINVDVDENPEEKKWQGSKSPKQDLVQMMTQTLRMDTEDSVDEADKDSLGLTALPEFKLNREYRDTLVLHGKSREEAEPLDLGQIPLG
ncbi:unnamed protein product [Tetraodon nigroviridis]|uniref:non-specific serine/threonine protein kinase n=1 Tax=Tetraodon nigroviridis TaxID=99883 RepID=Q4SRD0_TETNG|nr:unnamed protein product [Tetraodon nigroviridis]